MALPSELPQAYQDAITSFNTEIQKIQSLSQKISYAKAFCQKYTVLPEFHDNFDIGVPLTEEYYTFWCKISQIYQKKLSIDFPEHPNPEYPNFTMKNRWLNGKKLTKDEMLKFFKAFVSLPHSQLPIVYEMYREEAGGILPADIEAKYKSMCELYEKIQKLNYADVEDWIIGLLQLTNRYDYVIQNTECRLYQEPTNVKLWLAYITVMERYEDKLEDLLKVYSRYCRLFIDDIEMRNKYEAKIKVFYEKTKKAKFWIDFIRIKADFDTMASAESLLTYVLSLDVVDGAETYLGLIEVTENYEALKHFKTEVLNAAQNFLKELSKRDDLTLNLVIKVASYDTPASPEPTFPDKLSSYISTKWNPLHLEKLYKTCKFYFHHYRIILVKNYTYGVKKLQQQIVGQSLNISQNNYDDQAGHRYWITNSFYAYQEMPPSFETFAAMSLKSLRLERVSLKYTEYQLLTSSGTIEKLMLLCVSISRDNDELITIAEALAQVPNVIYINIHIWSIFQQNQLLMELGDLMAVKFNQKLQYLELDIRHLNPNLMADFCLKNMDDFAYIKLNFNENSEVFKSKLASWSPKHVAPYLDVD